MASPDRNQPPKSNDPAAAPAIPGEKRVPGTQSAVPVDPPKAEADREALTEPAAADHRKQFTGSDDHRGTGGSGS